MDAYQQSWDYFVQSLTYAYNTQLHSTKEMPPFGLKLSRKLPGSLTFTGKRRTLEGHGRLAPSQIKRGILDTLFAFLYRAEDKFIQARQTYKSYFAKEVKHLKRLELGDLVYTNKPPLIDDTSVTLRP